MKRIIAFALFTIALAFLSAPAFAAEASCPVQLEESHTQSLLIAQSRDQLEQRMAQAIRANREYAQLHEADTTELKKVREEVAALKAKLADLQKPEAPK